MYGWRGRIGFIAPAAVNDLAGIDFYRVVPDGVMVVTTCLGIQGLVDNTSVEQSLANLDRCVKALVDFNADMICLGGNPPAVAGGPEHEQELIERMQRVSEKPVTTSPRSGLEALRAVGAKSVAIASPLPAFQDQKLAAFFEYHGLRVTNIHSLEVKHERIRLLDRSASYRACKAAVLGGDRPDAVFMPCAAWPTLDSLRPVEEDLGVVAISSIAAMAWNCLRLLDISVHRPELGTLLGGAG